MKYFVSADVTFFEYVPHFSPQGPVTASESIPLPQSAPLSALAPVHDVSSSVSPTATTEPPAPKPFQDFRYHYTRRPKVSASESVPADYSPVEDPPSQSSGHFL